jgi:putative transposase
MELYLPGRIYSEMSTEDALGRNRKQLGGIFHELARQKECQTIEGHLVHDHVHMCIIELRISNGYKSFSRKPIFEALSSMCPISIIYAKLNKIPPKYAVASAIGFLKGKSALAIARQFSGKIRNLTGEHFWARGYAVSRVGFELEAVKKYIREQEQLDQDGRF